MNQPAMKSLLQKIEGYDFEYLIADLWTKQGWKTRVLQASRDRGIDVEARRSDPFEQKYLIQAKRYSDGNKVGSKMIQQYSSLRYQEENVDAVLIITTSSFTKQAKEIAADLNIKLINGDKLVKIIERQNAGDILDEYTSAKNKGISDESSQKATNNFLQTLNYAKSTDEYISKIAENAVGETVTKESLIISNPGSFWSKANFNTPVLLYLLQNEQPHFILECEKIRLPDQELLTPPNGACIVATNNRIFVVIGNGSCNTGFEISYRDIIGISEFGILRTKIKIDLKEGACKFIIAGTEGRQEADHFVRQIEGIVHSLAE